jgi:hypothetical protein
MNFTVVSYPKEFPWPTQWNKRPDGSWEKKEEKPLDKKKHEKKQPPLPFDNVDVTKLKEPKEDISYLRYFEAVLAYYKELRNDEKEREKWLRTGFADHIPLKKIELIESLYVMATKSTNFEEQFDKIPYAKEYYEKFCDIRAKKLDQDNHFKKYEGEIPEDQKRLYKAGKAYFEAMQRSIGKISVRDEDRSANRGTNLQEPKAKFFTEE